MRQGEGHYLYKDGREYKGGFSRGKLNGIGYYKDEHGKTRKGKFFNGERRYWIDEEDEL